MTAMFEIVEQHDIDPAQVKKLRVALSPPIFGMHGIFARYNGKFEALLSTHYVAAAILHDRELTLAQFEPERYENPALRRFAEQVEVRAEPALSGVQALVEGRQPSAGNRSRRAASIRWARPRTGSRARRSRPSSAPMRGRGFRKPASRT